MAWTGLDLPQLVPAFPEPISFTGMRTGRPGFKKSLVGRKARIRAQLRRVAPRGLILRNRIGAALRRRNVRTAGFLGIERKFYDTALTATALTASTDASGGEVDPSATSMIRL